MCDKLSMSGLPSVTRVHLPCVTKLPEVIYDSCAPSGSSVSRQMWGPRKAVPACAIFLVPKAACFGVAHSATLQSQDLKEVGWA